MPDPSRRRVLACAAGALGTLAGCSVTSLSGSDYDDQALRRLAEADRPERPYRHPLAVPDAMVARHRTRARDLLGEVPTSLDVPNELIADEIASERERVQRALRQEPEQTTGTEGESTARERARDRLRDARRARKDAASVLGRYLAATGGIDHAGLRRRRDAQRDRLASFRSAWAYRARDPVRAVLVHDHFEQLHGSVEHALTPWPAFPDDPAADTDAVGHLFEKVAEAAALLDELERYREQVTGDGTEGHRPALMAAATWLRRRARRESFPIEGPLERGVSAFDRDLGESAARYQFGFARDVVRDHSNSDLLGTIEEERYANAALFAATRRAAMTTLTETVETIESGPSESDVSADRIETMRDRAHETVTSQLNGDGSDLLARLLDPAFTAMREARNELQSGTSGTPARAYAQYRYAHRFAERAGDAADELAFLLNEASGEPS